MKKNANTAVGSTRPTKLDRMLVEFNAVQQEVSNIVDIVRDRQEKALEKAIQLGCLLRAMKEEVGHGKWETWADEHIKCIKKSTRKNYMALPKSQDLGFLKDSKNLHQAYIALEIISPAPPRKALPTPAAAPTSPHSTTIFDDNVEQSAAGPDLDAIMRGEVPSHQASAAAVLHPKPQAPAQPPAPVPVEQVVPPPINAPAPTITGPAVTLWLQTADGRDWAASYTAGAYTLTGLTERGAKEEDDLANGRCVRIATGPPMTPALMRKALEVLTALVPTECEHAPYADLLSTFAAEQIVAGRKQQRAYSPYTSNVLLNGKPRQFRLDRAPPSCYK